MKIFFTSALLLFAVQLSAVGQLSAQELSAPRSDKHVIILSMDGFRWDYTLEANTPTLDSLRRAGSYSQIYPVFPSNTFPNHYSMATGLHPNNHGITNNNFYDEELGRVLSVFEDADCELEGFWGGEPIWNTLEFQGGIAHIYMWPGSENVINNRQATVWVDYDHYADYYDKADQVVTSMKLPAESIPNLVMWYMPDPDAIGHGAGPNSEACLARVEYIDTVLSYFFAQMRELPNFADIDFIITSDHGMAQLSADKYQNLYGVIDDSKVKYMVAGAPFCIEVEEEYLDEAVALLNASGNLRAYRGDSMPEKYHFGTHPTRCTNIVIIPDMGWTLDYSEQSRGLAEGKLGAHGYDPFETEMQMVFFGAGPSFKRGYNQASFQNVNMYVLLCHLLGIEPATQDGDLGSVEGMLR